MWHFLLLSSRVHTKVIQVSFLEYAGYELENRYIISQMKIPSPTDDFCKRNVYFHYGSDSYAHSNSCHWTVWIGSSLRSHTTPCVRIVWGFHRTSIYLMHICDSYKHSGFWNNICHTYPNSNYVARDHRKKRTYK